MFVANSYVLPKRADRPIREMYAFLSNVFLLGSSGRSKLITMRTFRKYSPRATKFVLINNLVSPLANFPRASVRAFMDILL